MKQLRLVFVLFICTAASYANLFDGDLNRDLKVDLSDLVIFADQWLDPSGCSGRKDCADMDGDGVVNFSDFTVIAKRWMMDTLTPIITEFCASNKSLLFDGYGLAPDWIEIYNPLQIPVDLAGWALTDKKSNPDKWLFPEITLGAGEYLVVFASGLDRTDPAGQLHTNFKLDSDGEYLALTMDNGGTVVQQFDPYPRQYRDVSYGLSQQTETELDFVDKESMQGYFVAPTPGTKNGVAEAVTGPKIDDIQQTPELPADADDLVVTATVSETASAIDPQSVRLHYRVMYGPEVTVSMTDDGTGSDVTANDTIYTGVIPASAFYNKQMVRYYITASDTQGNTTRLPFYKSPQFSEQYFGTVIGSNTVQTQMDLFWWFVEDPTWYNRPSDGLYTKEYTASSLFYKGRFYDNVRTRLRGASSVVHKFPKQSLKLEFNQENRFYYSPEMDKLDEINVNALGVDKGFIRNHLSMNVFRDSGSPYSTSDMWLCYQNGQFHSVANFVEQVDEQYLKRNDLPTNGSLYKIYNYLDNSVDRPAWYPGVNPDTLVGVEKKTRRWEDNSDLQALVDGILTPANRTQFLFDNVNIPEVINVMCGNIINQSWDRFQKNYYMYCDSEGSGQWYLLPWDQKLGWGYLAWQNENLSGTHSSMSHPLYGGQSHPNAYGQWHRLDEAMLADSTIRQMYLRRLRTVLDEQLQAPTTPANERKIEAYINQMVAKIGTEVDADKAKWGVVFGGFRSFQAEMDRLINNYLVPKRNTLYNTHGPTGTGILPEAQVGNPAIVFGSFEATPDYSIIDDPDISPQDCEYIQLVNNNAFAVDISGWKLTGGVTFTFKPGTVIASNDSLYISPNIKAFRMRNTSPTGQEANFVVGGYDGHLSAWGETVNLLAADDTVIDTFSYAANPSDQQRYLRIAELMYNPSPLETLDWPTQDYEFVELTNIGDEILSLAGVRFSDGIFYSFPPDAHIAPDEYIVLAKNPDAFSARYTVPQNTQIFGGYDGQLSNSGERVTLVDHTGDAILDFVYDDKWYPATDGYGFSLVFWGDLSGSYTFWDDQAYWKAGVLFDGSPGMPEPDMQLMHYWSFNESVLRTYSRGGAALTILPGAETDLFMDTGQDFEGLNNRLDETTGSHLRVNNPLGASLTLHLPTTGYEHIVLMYETRRSGQGAGVQLISYTTDGVMFVPFRTIDVYNDNPVLNVLDFSQISEVKNNSYFAVRIEFEQGDGGSAGNNRFDNITLDGVPLEGTNQPPQLVEPIPFAETIEGQQMMIDLTEHFVDPEGIPLIFSAVTDKPDVLGLQVFGDMLMMMPHNRGEAVVTVGASDGVNVPTRASFRVLVYPLAHTLSEGNFTFGYWSPAWPEHSFPEHMLFLQSDTSDPGVDTPLLYPYFIPHDGDDGYHANDQGIIGYPYMTTGRSRINGLNEEGISFINTGRQRDLGGALAAVDTTDLGAVWVSWLGGTLLENSRRYAIRLQYRLGHTGPFSDVFHEGQPVEYQVNDKDHTEPFGPIPLPADVINQPYVQLLWRYYHVDGDSGSRAQLRLDNITVSGWSNVYE